MDALETMSGGIEGMWLFAVPMVAKCGRSTLHEGGDSILQGVTIYLAIAVVGLLLTVLFWAGAGGSSWAMFRGRNPIPGPRGFPIIGSLMSMGGQAHYVLAALAKQYNAEKLMALSMGTTRYVIASTPSSAREILHSAAFSDRPVKKSAQELHFARAIGFAPQGEYWRKLRRIAANYLFSPKRIASHQFNRETQAKHMIDSIAQESVNGSAGVELRTFLQRASLNNIMSSVFGKTYDFGYSAEAVDLQSMVREGFEVLGAFNWADHLPVLQAFDPQNIQGRCAALVPKVTAYVGKIIDEHRCKAAHTVCDPSAMDFVDVLLSMDGDDKLSDPDIIAVLWEMIFRGTETTAILTEWIMAELVLHPEIQEKLRHEVNGVIGTGNGISDGHISKLPFLQAVVKETLRLHPPGPLLSWARLCTEDVRVAGYNVPKGTTAMVNMHAISHDPTIWERPLEFRPHRFMPSEGGVDFDVKGTDTRLAPFGAGRRVCPGRALGLATVHLWVAKLVTEFQWEPSPTNSVDLTDVLKLSAEMAHPLVAVPKLFAENS